MNKIYRSFMLVFIFTIAVSIQLLAINLSYASSPGTWALTGSMEFMRAVHTGTLLTNGNVLITGGIDNSSNTFLSSAELYNPATGTFSPTGNMNTPRVLHTATLLTDGKVLLIGGADRDMYGLKSAEVYDPLTGTFYFTTGEMNQARHGHTATLLRNGKVLITGGWSWYGPDSALASAELYDPITGEFSYTDEMGIDRAWHNATMMTDGNVLITGGMSYANGRQVTQSAELFNTNEEIFSSVGNMITGREQHSATLLTSGDVLITGGDNLNGSLSSAEVYNQSSKTFSITTGSMNTNRFWIPFSSTILPNGNVLVAGGGEYTDQLSPLSSVELYDPTTGTFSYGNPMNIQRWQHTLNLLSNGNVLATGGWTKTAEIYTSPVIYNFGGFLPPVNLDKPFKLGSTIPVKFQLTDATGGLVSTATASFTLQKMSGENPIGTPIEAVSTSGADTGNQFRYIDDHYVFNLNSKNLSVGTWQLKVNLDDGMVHTCSISLK